MFNVSVYFSSTLLHLPLSSFSSHQALWPLAVRPASATLGAASPSFSRSSTTCSELPATTRGLHAPSPSSTVLLQTLQSASCLQQRSRTKPTAKRWRTRGLSTSVKLLVSFTILTSWLPSLLIYSQLLWGFLLNCHFRCFLVLKKTQCVLCDVSLLLFLKYLPGCIIKVLHRDSVDRACFSLHFTPYKKTELFRTGHTKRYVCSRVAGLTCSSSPLLQVRRADPSTHPHRRIEHCTVSWSACSFWCTRGVFAGGLARTGTTRKRLTRTSIVTIVLSLLDGERFPPTVIEVVALYWARPPHGTMYRPELISGLEE